MTERSITTDLSVPPALARVLEGGFCIGCGACAALENSPMSMRFDSDGCLRAFPSQRSAPETEHEDERLAAVCPFSGVGPNESALAKALFDDGASLDDPVGYHRSLFAGHVANEGFRNRGSSGGLASWLLCELLDRDMVDAVIHIGTAEKMEDKGSEEETPRPPPLFAFRISTSVAEIQAGARSRYYPVEMSEVLAEVRKREGRFAIVGVPCFVKAVRLTVRVDPVLRARIVYCIGLVCGHLKSARFADMLAWQLGITPGKLRDINFRYKLAGNNARDYGIEAHGMGDHGPVHAIHRAHDLYGYDWGWGYFKYKACEFCDDVFAETADATVGDAWLARYDHDSRGTNILVVRSATLQQMIDGGRLDGRLVLEPLSVADMIRSQAGGLRHRRPGLAYRLHLWDRRGSWRPAKRVSPGYRHINPLRRRILRLRLRMMEESYKAFDAAVDAGRFDVFPRLMEPVMRAYDALLMPVPQRWLYRIKTWLKLCIRKWCPEPLAARLIAALTPRPRKG